VPNPTTQHPRKTTTPNADPASNASNAHPTTNASGAHPATHASGAHPATHASGAHPATHASGAHPTTNASGAHPATHASGAHPATHASGAHPATHASGAHPATHASGAHVAAKYSARTPPSPQTSPQRARSVMRHARAGGGDVGVAGCQTTSRSPEGESEVFASSILPWMAKCGRPRRPDVASPRSCQLDKPQKVDRPIPSQKVEGYGCHW
jgi:hypothetical protein